MSYSAEISFKKIDGKDICKFFSEIKKKIIDNIDSIAEDDFMFSPFAKRLLSSDIRDFCKVVDKTSVRKFYYHAIDTESRLESEVECWIEKVFKYRWFYLADMSTLGVYGVPDVVKSLFDTTIYFQNSCDQDYEFEEWNGVTEFEAIAEKWRNKSDEEMLAIDPEYGESDVVDIDYYRRSLCYEEIWKLIEDTLWNDSNVTYIQMFGFYDNITYMFRLHVLENYMKWSLNLS